MSSVHPWILGGVFAPSLSLAADFLACARWRAYRPMAQSISELTAVGAPSRVLATVVGVARDAALAAFATGMLRSVADARAPRVMGRMVLANALIDASALCVLPRDYTQPSWSRRNTANTLVMAVGVACSIGAMVAGVATGPRWFRAASAGIPLSYAAATLLVLARRSGPGTAAATGAQERTMAYSYQLWVAALGVALMRGGG